MRTPAPLKLFLAWRVVARMSLVIVQEINLAVLMCVHEAFFKGADSAENVKVVAVLVIFQEKYIQGGPPWLLESNQKGVPPWLH